MTAEIGQLIESPFITVRLRRQVSFYAQGNYPAVVQTERLFGGCLLGLGGVVDGSGRSQHAFARNLPEQKLAPGLLFHTPRIERAQRPDDIRDVMLPASGGRGDARMIENCVNVNYVKI